MSIQITQHPISVSRFGSKPRSFTSASEDSSEPEVPEPWRRNSTCVAEGSFTLSPRRWWRVMIRNKMTLWITRRNIVLYCYLLLYLYVITCFFWGWMDGCLDGVFVFKEILIAKKSWYDESNTLIWELKGKQHLKTTKSIQFLFQASLSLR